MKSSVMKFSTALGQLDATSRRLASLGIYCHAGPFNIYYVLLKKELYFGNLFNLRWIFIGKYCSLIFTFISFMVRTWLLSTGLEGCEVFNQHPWVTSTALFLPV